jgi:MoaA/NifB/PqqE/SkfB family radical SAM enzyme
VPGSQAVAAFEAAVDRLDAAGSLGDGFVLEDAAKLRRLARHLRASRGERGFERPPCDAPWWSGVVDADGALRPCFFHEPVGDVRDGLALLWGSAPHRRALAVIRGDNPVCDACVCPKQRATGLGERLRALGGPLVRRA